MIATGSSRSNRCPRGETWPGSWDCRDFMPGERVIKPSREENECIAANLTSRASGNIVGAIPDRTKDREIGLIWGIPAEAEPALSAVIHWWWPLRKAPVAKSFTPFLHPSPPG